MSLLGYRESLAAADTDVVAALSAVAVVRVLGADAASFLQGQVSQDLDPLAIGESVEALVLSPQGKIEALVRVVRAGEEEFLVVAEDSIGEAVLERLRRFKIRVRAELALERAAQLSLYARPAGVGRAAVRAAAIAAGVPGSFCFALGWPNIEAAAVLAAPDALEASRAELALGDPAALEYLRICAGRPVAGRELDERTIAEEAGLVARTVSFTKGCYTGQELVARLDARGANVARRLRLVRAAESTAEVGDALREGASVLGELTSVAPAEDGGVVALGYFRRAVVPPREIELTGAAGAYRAEVLELPV